MASISKKEVTQACRNAVAALPAAFDVSAYADRLESETVEVIFTLMQNLSPLHAVGETYSAPVVSQSPDQEMPNTPSINSDLVGLCMTVAQERALMLLQCLPGKLEGGPLLEASHVNHATREIRGLASVTELPILLRDLQDRGSLTPGQYRYALEHQDELMKEDYLSQWFKTDMEHMPDDLRAEARRQDAARREGDGVPYSCLLKVVGKQNIPQASPNTTASGNSVTTLMPHPSQSPFMYSRGPNGSSVSYPMVDKIAGSIIYGCVQFERPAPTWREEDHYGSKIPKRL